MRFEVRALKPREGVVSLLLEAPDAGAAQEQARAQGLAVLSARPLRSFGDVIVRRRRAFPLLQFTQELVALLRAGLSLPETLETMVEKESRPEVRGTLQEVRDRLYEGRSFSQALEAQPAIFAPLYVATVRASERTGDLAEALARYIDYQEKLDVLRKKIVSASIYPAVLLGVGGLVTLFLLGYVVPRFSAIYAESGRDLPFLSRLLLDWGQLIQGRGDVLLAVLVVLAVGAVAGWSRVRRAAAAGVQRVPALRERLLVYHLARFYRTLGMLLRGGVPILPALGMVAGLLSPELREKLSVAVARVREGVALSDAMVGAGLTTPVAARMLRVGENSGDMAGMMERIAVFHDEELARWVDWFTKLFEPLLMAVIGVVIGAIVVLMYLPIFELAGSLQ
ncbi:type II secretion system F family protein [Ramlibacter sp. USB13]|uniref:Type II secretion system F family protein n=1 Tax=Ramlibacter cellulosilyticus TaxID=2764187 RepID=A0A923MT10_9BURK|nr:type II secretion system F family protein [Ramlibacter cellulosilyticus]MBC5784461.1 type II secretion system F family protein [Ramlibacter cellulosilyticus]